MSNVHPLHPTVTITYRDPTRSAFVVGFLVGAFTSLPACTLIACLVWGHRP